MCVMLPLAVGLNASSLTEKVRAAPGRHSPSPGPESGAALADLARQFYGGYGDGADQRPLER